MWRAKSAVLSDAITFAFGFDGYTLHGQVYLSSEIPFFIDINDPKGLLDIKQHSQNGLYNLEISLEKPAFHQLFNEQNAQINPKYLTMVHLSTIKTWQDYADRMKQKYDKVLNQKLPQHLRERKLHILYLKNAKP